MKATFILQNLTASAFDRLATLSDAERYKQLSAWAYGDLRHCVSLKIGTGQFRDRVEMNQILRNPAPAFTYKLEPRRGYKLATFEVK